MANRPQVSLTVGESGSGKSLVRCAVFLVDEFLIHEEGIHWSNFPVNHAGIAAYLKWPLEKVQARVRIIPPEVMLSWHQGISGPRRWFERVCEEEGAKVWLGSHIAIDEAHRYVGQDQKGPILDEWKDFIGGARHHGFTTEFLSQHETKMHATVRKEAGLLMRVVPLAQQTDSGLTGCKVYDLLQLVSKLTGIRHGCSVVQRSQPKGEGKFGAPDPEAETRHRWSAKHFNCYDSFNVIKEEGQGDGKGAEVRRPKEEFERYSLAYLLLWFWQRNFNAVTMRVGMSFFLFWLFCLGGGMWVIQSGTQTVLGATTGMGKRMGGQVVKPKTVGIKTSIEPTLLPEYADPAKRPAGRRGVGIVGPSSEAVAPAFVELEEKARKATAVVAMIGESLIFEDGSRVDVGETVSFGPWKGHRIESVDPRRQIAKFGNGRSVRLGVSDPDTVRDRDVWVQAESTALIPLPLRDPVRDRVREAIARRRLRGGGAPKAAPLGGRGVPPAPIGFVPGNAAP